MSFIMGLALMAAGSSDVTPASLTPQVEPAKKNQLICKFSGSTGSRLQKPKTCKTAADWRLSEQAAQKRIDEVRLNARTGSQ